MKKASYVIVVFIIVLTVGLYAIGPMNVLVRIVAPTQSFEDEVRIAQPDYSQNDAWAALPSLNDNSDFRPEGIAKDTSLAEIDVFYIHPTGYLKGHFWNARLERETATTENTNWMLANQASVFSDCRVYAPKYRQATIFAFVNIEGQSEKKALDLAYSDVLRAFRHFIKYKNQNRPFILAGHSQGSYHAFRLLKEEIDQTDLLDRMIAAYTIGMSTITNEAVGELKNIPICNSADQTQCLIHYATFANNAPEDEQWGPDMVCVNPLTWEKDGPIGRKELHAGYVPESGYYNLKFYGSDDAENVDFQPLQKPILQHTYCACVSGRLLVNPQIGQKNVLGKGNYHGLDFQLFHMNLRNNLSDRARAFSQKKYTL